MVSLLLLLSDVARQPFALSRRSLLSSSCDWCLISVANFSSKKLNFWKKKKKTNHHHHHRENVSDPTFPSEEKRREEKRETRASFAIEKKGLDDDDDDTSHTSPRIGEKKRENFRIRRTHKKEGFRAKRNRRKTRTLLLPPPPPGVVDFRAGFFSTSSSENRFGVGARRALFLSLIISSPSLMSPVSLSGFNTKEPLLSFFLLSWRYFFVWVQTL